MAYCTFATSHTPQASGPALALISELGIESDYSRSHKHCAVLWGTEKTMSAAGLKSHYFRRDGKRENAAKGEKASLDCKVVTNIIVMRTNLARNSTIKLNRLDSILQRQCELRRRNRRRHFIEASRFNVVAVAVHLQAKLPRLGIDYPPHSVCASKWLVSLQAVPRVACDSVVPPRAELGQP